MPVKTLTSREVERLRLILSTYQDGTGMLAQRDGSTLPGWRDFERSVALALGGEAQESKFIVDVLIPIPGEETFAGLSCKMRRELDRVARDGRATLELSNSSGKFWDFLNEKGLDQTNYKDRPLDVGVSLLELIEQWHQDVSVDRGGKVDVATSSYLVLLWNRAGFYQLLQYPLKLPDPRTLSWQFPVLNRSGRRTLARRLEGADESGALFEWYGESGGQLKYYPLAEDAIWTSEPFRLEPMPEGRHGVLARVETYFPELWSRVA